MKNILKATALSLAISLPALASDLQDDSAAAVAAAVSTRPTVEVTLAQSSVDFSGIDAMSIFGVFAKAGTSIFLASQSAEDKIVVEFGTVTFTTNPETGKKEIASQVINPTVTLPSDVADLWYTEARLHMNDKKESFLQFGTSHLQDACGNKISKVFLDILGPSSFAINTYEG